MKNLPAAQETQKTWFRSLGREDSLKEGMATHSSIFAGESHGQMSLPGYIPWGCKMLDMTEATKHAHTENGVHGKKGIPKP